MLSAVCIPATRIQCFILNTEIKFPVVIERGSHPFPFRTRQLSLSSPMILRGQLCGKVGRRRDKFYERPSGKLEGLFFFPLRALRPKTFVKPQVLVDGMCPPEMLARI